jgi:5-methylcytosine-specific restriction enzyme subunit McrC
VKIPIRNVYYLLLYAWDQIRPGEHPEVREEGLTHLHDLFASVLADITGRLVARGLDRGYVPLEETVEGVRGKLDLDTTFKRNLLANARTHCRFDELQYDVLHNQILKATLRALLALHLDRRVRAHVARVYRKMDLVGDVRITRRDFGRVQLHRNNRGYDLALRLCQLIYDNLMIEPGTGRARFRDFRRDEQQMGALFERFVYNFFRLEQERFEVSSPWIAWHEAWGSEMDLQRLPIMRTDVVLEAPDRCIILDTKFYAEALQSRFGKETVRSGHLYQILAYVENRAAAAAKHPLHEAMLLYPVVGRAFSFDYRLNGHSIRVRSLDLNQDWSQIRSDLLGLVGTGS